MKPIQTKCIWGLWRRRYSWCARRGFVTGVVSLDGHEGLPVVIRYNLGSVKCPSGYTEIQNNSAISGLLFCSVVPLHATRKPNQKAAANVTHYWLKHYQCLQKKHLAATDIDILILHLPLIEQNPANNTLKPVNHAGVMWKGSVTAFRVEGLVIKYTGWAQFCGFFQCLCSVPLPILLCE